MYLKRTDITFATTLISTHLFHHFLPVSNNIVPFKHPEKVHSQNEIHLTLLHYLCAGFFCIGLRHAAMLQRSWPGQVRLYPLYGLFNKLTTASGIPNYCSCSDRTCWVISGNDCNPPSDTQLNPCPFGDEWWPVVEYGLFEEICLRPKPWKVTRD